MIAELLDQGKPTGPNQSDAYIHYTKMNQARMRRLGKKSQLLEDNIEAIKSIDKPLTLLTITEAWCGDAAQILPVINHIAELNPLIDMKLILRDEHPDVMKHFLTNGSYSIPIIVVLDKESGEVFAHWGPRPKHMQDIVMARKEDPHASPYSEFVVEAQLWYTRDKSVSIQTEFISALKEVGLINEVTQPIDG